MRYLLLSFLLLLFSCKENLHNSRTNKHENKVVKMDLEEHQDSLTEKMDTIKGSGISGKQFIQKFYTDYIKYIDETPPNKFNDSILKKYCTNDLINRIKALKLDYDPLINSQDVTPNILKTLEISETKEFDKKFNISYIDGFSKEKVQIRMKIVVRENAYKIDSLNVNTLDI